jgi:hypothetical protein
MAGCIRGSHEGVGKVRKKRGHRKNKQINGQVDILTEAYNTFECTVKIY